MAAEHGTRTTGIKATIQRMADQLDQHIDRITGMMQTINGNNVAIKGTVESTVNRNTTQK